MDISDITVLLSSIRFWLTLIWAVLLFKDMNGKSELRDIHYLLKEIRDELRKERK